MFNYPIMITTLVATLLTPVFLSGCEQTKQAQQALPTVTYMKVVSRPLTLTSEMSGRASAFMVSEVRPQVSGIIQERLFVEGSNVKQGDVLYQIDPALYQAAHDSSMAALMKAEANELAAGLLAERYRKIVKVNAVSKQEYDNAVASHSQAKAEVAAAKAALDNARINLEYTRITAPISGRIDRSSMTPGALVTQNQVTPLATIQQLDPMYVDVTQSSSELLRLRRAFDRGELRSSGKDAMLVSLRLKDGSIYTSRTPTTPQEAGQAGSDSEDDPVPLLGTLQFSGITVEQSTGTVIIRTVFPNPDGLLLPGEYLRAIIEEGVSEKAILIPQKSARSNNRGLYVVQVLHKDDSISDQPDVFGLEARVITVDRSIDNQWLVTDGLEEGELILLEGIMRVRPGMNVKGVLENPAEKKAAGDQSQQQQGGAATSSLWHSPKKTDTRGPAPLAGMHPAVDHGVAAQDPVTPGAPGATVAGTGFGDAGQGG